MKIQGSHLLIVVLARHVVVRQRDPLAQLLAEGIEEFIGIPAAGRAGKGEQLLAAAQRAGAVLGRSWGALQADVGIGVHATLVVDPVDVGWEGLLPGEGQA